MILDRVVPLLMSGLGGVVMTAMLYLLTFRWNAVLRLEVGWTRLAWLRAPALLKLLQLGGGQDRPVLHRVKLALMLMVMALTAPLLWLAFVDAIARTSLITHRTHVTGKQLTSLSDFAWAMGLSLFLVAVAWIRLARMVRNRARLTAEISAYIAEGDRALDIDVDEARRAATASSLVTAALVIHAAVGMVGVLGGCLALLWR